MLDSDAPSRLLCFLSQGWFKGAFVSLDLPKQHTDSSGHDIGVKYINTYNFFYFWNDALVLRGNVLRVECGGLVFPRRRRQVSVSSPPFPFTHGD